MSRRTAPPRLAALLAASGMVVAAWGLVALEQVFVRERAEARQRIDERARTLAGYAGESLRANLLDELRGAEARATAALADPLVAADGLLWFDGLTQRLPRRFEPHPGDAHPAADRLDALAAGTGTRPVGEDESPAAERLALFAELTHALEADHREGIEKGVRAMLAHRHRFRVPAEDDLPLALAMLERLADEARPARALVAGVLADGIALGEGREVRPLLADLLDARGRLTRADATALAGRALALCSRFTLDCAAFSKLLHGETGAPVERPGRAHDDAAEVAASIEDGWLFSRHGERTLGVRVDLDEALAAVVTTMHARGLLAPDETVRLERPMSLATPGQMTLGQMTPGPTTPGLTTPGLTTPGLTTPGLTTPA